MFEVYHQCVFKTVLRKACRYNRSCKSKDRQYNGQIKRTNNDLNIEQQETHLKPIDELR